MKITWFLLLVFSFSALARTGMWFSSDLKLKDKIRHTQDIRKQMEKDPFTELSELKEDGSKSVKRSPGDYKNIRMILGLPLENRKQALAHYGTRSFFILRDLVSSRKEQLPVRWKALTSLARLYPNQSLPIIKQSLKSSSWFLKNGGLIAMEIVDPKEAVRSAGELLNDPALVVRTAAVNMIQRHQASQYKIHLLNKLNAPDSFYKNRSLWIRHHIVTALADFSKPGEEKMFMNLLQDSDSRLHAPAMRALEKLTGKNFRSSDADQELAVQEQRQNWITWWSGQSGIVR